MKRTEVLLMVLERTVAFIQVVRIKFQVESCCDPLHVGLRAAVLLPAFTLETCIVSQRRTRGPRSINYSDTG